MPTLAAALVASVAGWVVDELLQSFLGTGTTLVVSLVCTTVIYVLARRWLIDLRGR